jgi:hypothetical protein
MREIVKKILKEYIDEMKDKVDYAQEKLIKKSDYPSETKMVDTMKDNLTHRVKRVYKDITGEEPENHDNIVVKVDDDIKDGKIGSFKHPENKKDLGVMKVHPKAMEDIDYVENIIKHELIHAAHGLENTEARNHKGVFQKVADKVGLPKKYRH